MAINEINARAAINFLMTRLHGAQHCPRSPEDAFTHSRACHQLCNFRLAFLCEFGGNPSFLLIRGALSWRRRGRGREQEPGPAIALSDGCFSEIDRFTEGTSAVCCLLVGLISHWGEDQR
jgi:hypothetical protein